jgi:hypothetical protein
MDAENIITAIKEFFLEILGFLIPGIILITLVLIQFNNFNFIKYQTFYKENYILLIFIAYSLGYVIYGVSLTRDEFFKWLSKYTIIKIRTVQEKAIGEITTKNTFERALEIINKKSNTQHKIEDFNEARNYAISGIPSSDTIKVYTNMFRADLCDHLQAALSLILSLGLLNLLVSFFSPYENLLFCNSIDHLIYIYIPSLISIYFLGKTRYRYFTIAYKIPFSMYIEKIESREVENKKNV